MEDGVGAADGVADGGGIADVAADEVDPAFESGEVLGAAAGEVVEDADAAAASEESADEGGADESGAAGDEAEGGGGWHFGEPRGGVRPYGSLKNCGKASGQMRNQTE